MSTFVVGNVIDGKAVAASVRSEIKAFVNEGREKAGRAPGLGVILVGDNPASKSYVAGKEKAALECGFETFDARLSATATESEVKAKIKEFNSNSAIDGILLQLPLPKGLSQDILIPEIDPSKDADGLHPQNQGLLMQGRAELRPCTPYGVMKLLDVAGVTLAGKRAIVIGRSILVGKPISLMLLEKNATVTMAHSKTEDLPALCREHDVVIAAVGVRELVKGDWLKGGAVVIDVGINRTDDGKLVGDCEFESCRERASLITPVPGGVGPMTVAMLLWNTYLSWKKRTQ